MAQMGKAYHLCVFPELCMSHSKTACELDCVLGGSDLESEAPTSKPLSFWKQRTIHKGKSSTHGSLRRHSLSGQFHTSLGSRLAVDFGDDFHFHFLNVAYFS